MESCSQKLKNTESCFTDKIVYSQALFEYLFTNIFYLKCRHMDKVIRT